MDIPEGTHEITFRYFPGGLKTGAVISAAAAGILLLIYIGKKRYGRRPKRIRMPAATEGSGAANTEENTAKGGLDYETLGRTLHKRDE